MSALWPAWRASRRPIVDSLNAYLERRKTVSYTHLDVYKRQAEGGFPSELVDALRDNKVVVTGRVADDFFGNPAAAVRQEIYITDQGSRDSVAYRIGGVCEKQRYCEFTGYDYAYYKLVDENKVAEEGDWVGEGLNLSLIHI